MSSKNVCCTVTRTHAYMSERVKSKASRDNKILSAFVPDFMLDPFRLFNIYTADDFELKENLYTWKIVE